MTKHDERSTTEIRRDIERTRERIEERARALEGRLDPGELFNRAIHGVRSSGAAEFVNNLGRSVRDSPLAVLLTAAGVTMISRSSGQQGDGDDVDDGSPGVPGVKDRVREAKDKLGATARTAKARFRRAAQTGRARARSARSGLDEAGRRVQHGWNRMLEEQPLLLGLFGLAAGAAIAASLPPTETEDEWVGDTSDELKSRAASSVREQAEELRQRASEGAAEAGGRSGSSTSSGSSPT